MVVSIRPDLPQRQRGVPEEEVDVGFDAFGRPVAEVVTACEGDEKASLWDKVKAHFK